MKYGITLLLLITHTAHAGLSLSRHQRMPSRYIYVTPTLHDNNQTELFSGKYSYVLWNDNSFSTAQRPSQHDSTDIVDITSAVFNRENDTQHKLSLLYAINKIASDGSKTIQQKDSLEFVLGAGDDTLEHIVPNESQTLKFVIEQVIIRRQ